MMFFRWARDLVYKLNSDGFIHTHGAMIVVANRLPKNWRGSAKTLSKLIEDFLEKVMGYCKEIMGANTKTVKLSTLRLALVRAGVSIRMQREENDENVCVTWSGIKDILGKSGVQVKKEARDELKRTAERMACMIVKNVEPFEGGASPEFIVRGLRARVQ